MAKKRPAARALAEAYAREARRAINSRGLPGGVTVKGAVEGGVEVFRAEAPQEILVNLSLPGRWTIGMYWVTQNDPLASGDPLLLESSVSLNVESPLTEGLATRCLVRYDVDNRATNRTLGYSPAHLNVLQASGASPVAGSWYRLTEGSPEAQWSTAGYLRRPGGRVRRREGNTQDLADFGIEQALRELATPRESPDEPKEVDAEPEPTGPSVLDQLRNAGGRGEAEAALSAPRTAQREQQPGFRSGVERKAFRQIQDALTGAERSLELVKRPDLSDWSRAEALVAAGRGSCSGPAS